MFVTMVSYRLTEVWFFLRPLFVTNKVLRKQSDIPLSVSVIHTRQQEQSKHALP